jgi:hypothetical protein
MVSVVLLMVVGCLVWKEIGVRMGLQQRNPLPDSPRGLPEVFLSKIGHIGVFVGELAADLDGDFSWSGIGFLLVDANNFVGAWGD